jgi:hypothetical protein
MDSLRKQDQILFLRAFAMAVRSGRFSELQFNTLAEGTVRGTIPNVVQTFQSLGRENPTKDADNNSLEPSDMKTLRRNNKKAPLSSA